MLDCALQNPQGQARQGPGSWWILVAPYRHWQRGATPSLGHQSGFLPSPPTFVFLPRPPCLIAMPTCDMFLTELPGPNAGKPLDMLHFTDYLAPCEFRLCAEELQRGEGLTQVLIALQTIGEASSNTTADKVRGGCRKA